MHVGAYSMCLLLSRVYKREEGLQLAISPTPILLYFSTATVFARTVACPLLFYTSLLLPIDLN